MHDVIVIGAGPAGMAAGLYAAASKLKTLVIAREISDPKSADFELLEPKSIAKQFKHSLKANKDYLEFLDKTEAVSVEKNVVSFSVEIQTGKIYYSRAAVVATGNGGGEPENIALRDSFGKIKVNGKMQTSIQGLFAAGDVTASGERFVLSAAGEGARAAKSVLEHLARQK